MRLAGLGLAVIMITTLTACENTGLRSLRGGSDGPDEFVVVPTNPLSQPANYNDLPPPTPGQTNLEDQRPLQESAAALGGRRAENGPVPSSDATLVAYASRDGIAPDIRASLAEEDERFRRRWGRLTQFRIVPVDRYNQVYQSQALDPQVVLEQYRQRGIQTPSAPPSNSRINF